MGEIHFIDNDGYDTQSLDFSQASIITYSKPQVGSKNNLQLNDCKIECKEACIELDYLNSCCNVECIAYNKDLEELGKFEFHTDREDQFYQYGKNEDNLFGSRKSYTLILSDFSQIS